MDIKIIKKFAVANILFLERMIKDFSDLGATDSIAVYKRFLKCFEELAVDGILFSDLEICEALKNYLISESINMNVMIVSFEEVVAQERNIKVNNILNDL